MEMDSSRRRRLILMTLGIVLAVVAGGIAFVLSQQPRDQGTAVQTTPVVVATRDIEARTTLVAEDLTVVDLPTDAVLAQTYTSVEQALGRVAVVRILQDQQVTPNLFVGGTAGPQGSPRPFEIIPADETIEPASPFWRAVAVSVPRNRAVAGQLIAGDRVDLLVSVEFDTPLQPIEDEDGNITYEEVSTAVALVDPVTGEVRGIVGGQSTKITFQDLEILQANAEENLYILKVDLTQAEQINHIAVTAPDSFSLVLRPGQDTRAINLEDYGETTDQIIMNYVYQVPELVDLATLLGLTIEPLPPGASPSPEPEPSPGEEETPPPEEPSPSP